MPEDGPFSGVTVRYEEEEDGELAGEEEAQEERQQEIQMEAESFVPSIAHRSEQQHVSARAAKVLNWPVAAREPVNEFRTEGYLTMAFPTLFPDGAGDLSTPRLTGVTAAAYLHHLMLLEDGRFARYHRFRYVALNTVMRWRALQTGRVYVHKHPGSGSRTVEDLRQLAKQGHTSFAKSVYHYGNNLAGSPAYWSQRCARLVQRSICSALIHTNKMVEELGLPTLLVTLSAADLQWPELFEMLGLPEETTHTTRAHALNSNPAAADWLFWRRVQLFMKAYYVDLLGAADYWMRVEYQHRGSPHIHGLVWLPNAPALERLNIDDEAEKQRVIAFIDTIVTTQHPVGCEQMWEIVRHPNSVRYAEVADRHKDLAELTSFCQVHRCRPGHCLKTTTNGNQECRFKFPKQLAAETLLTRDENGTYQLPPNATTSG